MTRHSSGHDDRSPGDFHSTGASYVPRKDSRGTKPARGTPYLWLERAISRAAKHYEINTITMQRSNEMANCIPEGHSPKFLAAWRTAP